jgi:alpha/beta hydrolase fold
MCCEPAPT